MITDWILNALQTGLDWFSDQLPTDNTHVWEYVNQVGSHLADLNYFLPIGEVVALVVAVFVLFPIFAGVSLLAWVYAQVRGSSSVG